LPSLGCRVGHLVRALNATLYKLPQTFGGYIIAAAVDHGHMVQYLDDLLTAAGQVRLLERTVRPDEIGKFRRISNPMSSSVSTEPAQCSHSWNWNRPVGYRAATFWCC
jgi:hypothetical protein